MAKKRKRRATKKKKTTTKKKKQSMDWVITGIVLVLVAVLSCVHFGLFSQQLINLIRFFVGDSHYLASIILGLFCFTPLYFVSRFCQCFSCSERVS